MPRRQQPEQSQEHAAAAGVGRAHGPLQPRRRPGPALQVRTLRRPAAALFDLEEDPKQLRNLADDSGYKPIMLAYAQKMLSWRMENMERTLTGMAARGSWCALEAQRWTMRGARGRTEDGQ